MCLTTNTRERETNRRPRSVDSFGGLLLIQGYQVGGISVLSSLIALTEFTGSRTEVDRQGADCAVRL
jgi:hypothetical protein